MKIFPKISFQKLITTLLFLLAFFPVAGGLFSLNPFENRFFTFLLAAVVYSLCSFFLTTQETTKRILFLSTASRLIIHYHPIFGKKPWKKQIWKINLNSKTLKIEGMRLAVRFAFAALLALYIFLCSVCAAVCIFPKHYAQEYQTALLNTSQILDENIEKALLEDISMQIDRKSLDTPSLREDLQQALSGDLQELYNRSAWERSAAYLQSISSPLKLNMASSLCVPDFNSQKQSYLDFAEKINVEEYECYLQIYQQYEVLLQEYQKIISQKEYFHLDSLVSLRRRLNALKSKIALPMEYDQIRYAHSFRAHSERVDCFSGSVMARLEGYHVKGKLKKEYKVLIYECEDKFLTIYDKLNELKNTINQILLCGFGETEPFSFQEMEMLVEHGSLHPLKAGQRPDCTNLKKMEAQLLRCINFRYAGDSEKAERQIEALTHWVRLHERQVRVEQLSQEGASDDPLERDTRLHAWEVLLEEAGFSEDREDIMIIESVLGDENIWNQLRFLLFTRFSCQVEDLSAEIRPVRMDFLKLWGKCVLFYFAFGMLCCLINRRKGKNIP